MADVGVGIPDRWVNLTVTETSFALASVGISFIVYDILLVITCIIACGKLAPCATLFHCTSCLSSTRQNQLLKKSRKTPLLIAIVLQIFVIYNIFRVIESIQEIIYYALKLSGSLTPRQNINWFLGAAAIESIGYFQFIFLYSLFVAIFLKGGLLWIRNKPAKITILVLSSLLFLFMNAVLLIQTLIAINLMLFYFPVYFAFATYGFALYMLLFIIFLTIVTFIISISLIAIIAKSNRSKAKITSQHQKMEQTIVVCKLILASFLFFISNTVYIFGFILYAFDLYYYIILIIRVIPDMFITMGIVCVFWPFNMLPIIGCLGEKQKQSKVTQFIQQVAESYDMIDEFDPLTDTSTSTPRASVSMQKKEMSSVVEQGNIVVSVPNVTVLETSPSTPTVEGMTMLAEAI